MPHSSESSSTVPIIRNASSEYDSNSSGLRSKLGLGPCRDRRHVGGGRLHFLVKRFERVDAFSRSVRVDLIRLYRWQFIDASAFAARGPVPRKPPDRSCRGRCSPSKQCSPAHTRAPREMFDEYRLNKFDVWAFFICVGPSYSCSLPLRSLLRPGNGTFWPPYSRSMV